MVNTVWQNMNLIRSLLMKGSPKTCPQTGSSVSVDANANPQLFNDDDSSVSALLYKSKSISVAENPSSKQKACSGAVRNMVNRLPFEECEQSDTKGGKRLGERSIATDSPFSASVMTLKALLFSLSMIKRSGLLVNGRKSDGYMEFDPLSPREPKFMQPDSLFPAPEDPAPEADKYTRRIPSKGSSSQIVARTAMKCVSEGRYNIAFRGFAGNVGSAISCSKPLHILKISRMDVLYVKQALIFKQVYKKLVKIEDPMESFYLIDIIQRFGIEHYFAEEIKVAHENLHLILNTNPIIDFVSSHELYEVALAFRLLRQGGHYVNADLFDSLKCNKRMFEEKYGEDVKGLIALYEASQLSIEGEDSLNDVGYLCCELLHAWLSRNQEHNEALYVANTLQNPLHYGLSRFMDKSTFIHDLKAEKDMICLEELAKINSGIVRFMNQNETIDVSKWWKELGLDKEVKFSGYQPLKWYTWPMACFTDPNFSEQRIELTKPISLIYVIDDIFDVHGTLDQLTIFTDAINRWETTGTEQLPNFMIISLNALYDITNNFAENVYKKHGFNPINTLKKSWIRLLNAFMEEAHWLNSGHLPKAEDYLNNGIVSTGVHVVLEHAFFLLDHVNGITKETIDILDENFPNVIYSVAKILRLSDDLEGAKSGDQNGLDGSYLDCYMSEHQGISSEDVQTHVAHMISNEWKCLNQEILVANQFSSSFSNFCLNAARMVPLMYHYKSNPSLSNLHEHVKSLINVSVGCN